LSHESRLPEVGIVGGAGSSIVDSMIVFKKNGFCGVGGAGLFGVRAQGLIHHVVVVMIV
jgi:hypothetical protein